MTKQKLWELIEAYRTSGGSEEHHARKERLDAVLDELLEQPAQQQEPVGHVIVKTHSAGNIVDFEFDFDAAEQLSEGKHPAYTSPQQAQRKPLTHKQLADAWIAVAHITHATERQIAYARAIEAKLK